MQKIKTDNFAPLGDGIEKGVFLRSGNTGLETKRFGVGPPNFFEITYYGPKKPGFFKKLKFLILAPGFPQGGWGGGGTGGVFWLKRSDWVFGRRLTAR